MPGSSIPMLAREAQATETHLVVLSSYGRTEIRWEQCSEKLLNATTAERTRLRLSPSGCSIHWPLVDEDLAVGPLLMAGR